MRSQICGALVLILALVLGSGAALAESGRQDAILELEAAKTQINFTLNGFPHTTTGAFKLKSGEIRVDPQTGAAGGAIVVDAGGGTTGIGMRDSQMKDTILEVRRFPEISFNPRHVQFPPVLQGDFTVRVSGVMLLHGDPHDMTVDVAIHRSGDSFTAAAHFAIPYVQWGLKNPSLMFLRVSDEVAIDVSSAGHVTLAPSR